ncbi:putative heme oxygenase [Gordonia spumicola]|uniref:Putative heme oxygenase n=1 Tax=Gordonia spumicola TaxID=589161 RepID=A0A7I9V6E8_9ACTN|nr:biliverdin-producing heme oxygenase [Gordonia spumicola]GEE00989.1 putative heme oxygenase [Gordonia spumicola]
MTVDTATVVAPEDTLSAAMKKGSAAEHDQAEGSSFMSDLLGGKMPADGYVAYLRRLRPVYEALESTARALAADPIASKVIDPALDRLATIDADLEHWAPGADQSVDSPAATAYAQRILASAEWGGSFVAHHYTRYLGDLSGGQAIGRILDRNFELDGAGISFYAFDEVGKVKPYKDDYRDRLDEIGATLSQQERARLVDEVKAAFNLNQALFAELGALYPS